jgi:hypothetical protein
MAEAGHEGALYVSNVSVATTGESCTSQTTTRYIIDEITRRWIDPDVAPTVYENGSPTAQQVTYNRLNGTVTFASGPTEPVTMDYNYLVKARAGCVKGFRFSRKRTQLDRTCIKLSGETDAGAAKRLVGLKDVDGDFKYIELEELIFGSVGSEDKTLVDEIEAALDKDDWWMLEINIANTKVFRAFIYIESFEVTAEVDNIIEGVFNWVLSGPDGEVQYTYEDYVADI